jgi:hypothetical protein
MCEYQTAIENIVNTIEISDNFAVKHPEYPPLELTPEVAERYQSLPSELRSKYLILQVQNYLHDIYFSGSLLTTQELERRSQQPVQIKNNIIDGIDVDFAVRLKNNNLSNGYLDPGWEIVDRESDGTVIVVKDGLYLHIDPRQHLPKDVKKITNGTIVSIYLPHNLLGVNSYIAVGNYGYPDRDRAIDFYFNYAADTAIAWEQKLIRELNKTGTPFQLEILFNPQDFHRQDAGILNVPQSAYERVKATIEQMYEKDRDGFSAPVPLFTKPLLPGIGMAETNPDRETFGLHRCRILATSLVEIYNSGPTDSKSRVNTIASSFQAAGLNLSQPYLNPGSIQN